MARLGLAARLALIVAGGLVLAQIMMTMAYFADRRGASDGATIGPLMGQVAALVQVLDLLPPDEHELALRATTAPGFLARIGTRPSALPPLNDALPVIERRLRAQIKAPPERYISASIDARAQFGAKLLPLLAQWRGAHLNVVVGLADGRYLEVEATGDLTARLFGIPVGLVAGLLGVGVALVAVIAVRRETRPLSDLSAALDRFGHSLDVQEVNVRGAPDVRRLVSAFDAMQRRIVELVRGRSLVLGAISHDLRTYVTRLRLRLELLPEGPQVSRAQADLEEMQGLLDDALSVARGAFGIQDGAPADLAAVVAAECTARAAQGAPVRMGVMQSPSPVRGSVAGLKRIAANLIGNAIAYGDGADVSVITLGDSVELMVEDRGPGIPHGERVRVFEPFYRLEASRSRDTGGAGLGLTIVQQIVEGLGGSVAIADRPGGGACLCVRLPVSRDN
ncbi:HAMP domain-containing sensor histidine kinase [Azorhizobium sp. AG788]|uniref:sensor histidine kinase n=1 Tax=Azorhizobium sp. AG788 TaxID=2183897 RepID=UPI00313899E9